jgi:hypothetical protein
LVAGHVFETAGTAGGAYEPDLSLGDTHAVGDFAVSAFVFANVLPDSDVRRDTDDCTGDHAGPDQGPRLTSREMCDEQEHRCDNFDAVEVIGKTCVRHPVSPYKLASSCIWKYEIEPAAMPKNVMIRPANTLARPAAVVFMSGSEARQGEIQL